MCYVHKPTLMSPTLTHACAWVDGEGRHTRVVCWEQWQASVVAGKLLLNCWRWLLNLRLSKSNRDFSSQSNRTEISERHKNDFSCQPCSAHARRQTARSGGAQRFSLTGYHPSGAVQQMSLNQTCAVDQARYYSFGHTWKFSHSTVPVSTGIASSTIKL